MKVVVVGAGYAGVIAANRLRKRSEAQVTVINPRPEFVQRIRLHQHIADAGTATVPLVDMLRPGIAVRSGAVDKIGDGGLTITDGGEMEFDHLVYAVGAGGAAPAGTFDVGTWEDAEAARVALAALPARGTVVVVGGGLTGIETAAEVAAARPDLSVRLISPELGASLSDGARARVEDGLRESGVQIVRDTVVPGDAGLVPGDAGFRLGSGGPLDADLVLWAIAHGVADLAARSGWDVDAAGRVVVDERLRSVSDPRVFAAGDAAAVPGSRMSCAASIPQGTYVGEAVARLAAGADLQRPFSMGFGGQCVSLGRTDGLIQLGRRDDTPIGLYVGGRTAAAIKERVCRGAVFAARTAPYAWIPGPR